MLWIWLSCTATLASEAAPASPLSLTRPFAGEPTVSNFFDHGATVPGMVRRFDDALVWGIRGHHAYDFNMAIGTPLLAMAPGVVRTARDLGPKRCSDGREVPDNVQVHVAHPDSEGRTVVARYQHLSAVQVAVGDVVTAGQQIALSGNTGCSSGPHLHLELRRQGQQVDPYREGMWQPGAAPTLRRMARTTLRSTVGPHRMVGTDALSPVGGEWVDVKVREGASGPVPMRGMTLHNNAGDRYVLPAVTVSPGDAFRVWTNNPTVDAGSAGSWNRAQEAWSDAGDCATLRDASGAVVGRLSFGRRGTDHCEERR